MKKAILTAKGLCKSFAQGGGQVHVLSQVDITLYEGNAYDRMFTCDFSYDYVKINGSYRT